MEKILFQYVYYTLFYFIIGLGDVLGQVTTAQIQGIINDDQDNPLFGASIYVKHEPTGTSVGTISLENGRFTIPNLRVGGPYRIEVNYIGYSSQIKEQIYLALGDKLEIDFTLSESSNLLNQVNLVGSYDQNLLGKNKTGASTEVGRRALETLPTISRSASDYTRLSPLSDGNSFGGRNNRFNNFSLDGSVFNNPYGLDSAVPGGQSSAQPVSLDAIDQIQINIAPYDVTLAGFTGALVNAVTKSGTNRLEGSAFSFFRNQDLTGSTIRSEDLFRSDLTHLQSGFTLGGPIIKNKLFFFANLEIERRSDQGSDVIAARPGLTGEGVSRVLASDLDLVSKTLQDRYGYQTGPYEKYTHRTDNTKGLIKLDWNINESHSLVATYNFLTASKDLPAHPVAGGRRDPDRITLQFYNSGYQINNILHAGIVELKSNFNNKTSNNLQIGISFFNDFRNPFSEPFPIVNINKNNIRYIVGGHEPYSIKNVIKQRVYQITNNFNIYLPNHNITIGGSFEMFDFDNGFNLGWYDPIDIDPPYPSGTFGPGFDSVASFVDFVNNGSMDPAVNFVKEVHNQANWKVYFITVGQFAIYLQDRWQVNQEFVLTYGLRLDVPLYFNSEIHAQRLIDTQPGEYDDSIIYYETDGSAITFDNTVFPKTNPLISPRIGFNWDINDLSSAELRGGIGVFSGRIPFVWIGNQIGNPFWYFRQAIHPDFRFPQVLRTNLGYDQLLGNGWSSSIDIIYTKDINAMLVRNYGLIKPTGRLKGVDNRQVYTTDDFATYNGLGFPVMANIYVFTNTDVGSSFNSSFKIQKYWNRTSSFSIAYNFLVSKDANSVTSEITSSAFNNNPAIGDVNQAVSSHSRFGNKHRFVGTINKGFEYGRWSTTIGVFFEYAQGGRFSYTYSGDANGDRANTNDLIYIPTRTDLESMMFAGNQETQIKQKEALESFIIQDPLLRNNRGAYTSKFDHLLPWNSTWDIRILQDYQLEDDNKIQFSIDILNIGNLISSNWGIKQRASNSQPIGISVTDGIPEYTFDSNLFDTFTDNLSLNSRWRLQFGLRYSF